MNSAQLRLALDRAEHAFQINRRETVEGRSVQMMALAQGLRRERGELAELITSEMGKPIMEAQAEVDKCAVFCEYFALKAATLLADEPAPSDSPRSFVAFRPLGVVLAIMPWNYPLAQVLRFLAPALMAGNSALLKHAENCFGCAMALERLVREAGFPEGALTAIMIGSESIEKVIANPVVQAITLTGSDVAGSKVAAICGREIKKAVLELGGSDFFIVFEDADLAQAAEVGVRSRFQNTGQSCIAAKRFLIAEEVADEFQEHFIALASQLTLGNPMDPANRLGPLARRDLREKLHKQVERSLAAGGKADLGGRITEGSGFFYPATVITGAEPGMAIFDEETFGPVASFTRFRDQNEAIGLANQSRYGLGGNLWTQDLDRGVSLAAQFDTGAVFVNGMTHADARIPFGGVKRSGFGRELSQFGIREFTNIQTVWRP
jgi:succinate-semialdehyde dehydrogenase/glutarate-semialdehyde dehydrogenase